MTIDGVTYKIANCRKEREDAFRLCHDMYVKAGLMPANQIGMRASPFHLLPTTDIFLAYHDDQPIYTMTLISDDEIGIPMQKVFDDEMIRYRAQTDVFFAEVSSLASQVGYFPRRRMFQVFVRLASLMVQSARENGVERLLIACLRHHARFYKMFLGFRQIFNEQMYTSVGKLAVGCEHDFARNDRDHYKLYNAIYDSPFRNWELYHQPMLQEDRDYFREMTEQFNQGFPLESVH